MTSNDDNRDAFSDFVNNIDFDNVIEGKKPIDTSWGDLLEAPAGTKMLPSLDDPITCKTIHPWMDKIMADMNSKSLVSDLTDIQHQLGACIAQEAFSRSALRWAVESNLVPQPDGGYVISEDQIVDAVNLGISIAFWVYERMPKK
jgi:hypothetical protein